MVMRSAQIRKLDERAVTSFCNRMADHLRERFPERWARADRKRLTNYVQQQMERAEQYAIRDESDVELYLDCASMLGDSFDRDASIPWASQTLNRQDLAAPDRMQLIEEHLVFHWEARQR